MVNFNGHGRKKVDMSNSSKGFDAYIDKLNAMHPDKSELLGDAYNYGMDTSIQSLQRQQQQMLHDELEKQKKHQKEAMREIKEKLAGKPRGFIE